MRIRYENLIRIKRLKTSGTIGRALVATATAEANIQPLGKQGGQLDTGVFGRSFVAYMGIEVSIQKGDRVIDDKNNQYDVTEVVERDFGAFPYKEVILQKT